MLYLIAHKVRGEAAFDVATKIQIGQKEGWIIPTSGHRAYPEFSIPLFHILQEDMQKWKPNDSLRDHYKVSTPTSLPRAPQKTKLDASANELLARIGL